MADWTLAEAQPRKVMMKLEINDTHPRKLSKAEIKVEMAELKELVFKCDQRYWALIAELYRRERAEAIVEEGAKVKPTDRGKQSL
jgi:hypothetical protein